MRIHLFLVFFLLSSSVVSANLLIQEPSFGEEFAFDKTPLISWSGCSEESYLVQIATDALFESIVFQQVVASSSYELEAELDANRYFLRVNAIGESGEFSCVSPTSEFELKDLSPLSFFFDTSEYDTNNLLKIQMNGPVDAQVNIEVTGDNFFLPISLDDLAKPDFELELNPGVYDFAATSLYADGELTANQQLTLGDPTPQSAPQEEEAEEESQDRFNLSIKVIEFEGDPLEDISIRIENGTNTTATTNESGIASILLSEDEYELFFDEDGYTADDEVILLQEDLNFTFYVIPDDIDGEVVQEEETTESQVITSVEFTTLDQTAYSTSFLPLEFTLQGSASRCQVLTKNPNQPGYEITETILSPKGTNKVILTSVSAGEMQIRIRCILSDDEAVISQTQTIEIVDIESDRSNLQSSVSDAQDTLSKINNFPTSFTQIFIDDVVKLENYISTANELIKKAATSSDILSVRDEIRDLNAQNTDNFLRTIRVNDSQNIISYGSIDDAELVVEYLDLAKSPKKLLDEQEQFAIKTNYNFVTLTYASGLILKQTFVSNQVLTVQGVDYDISYDEYYVMPSFLTQRIVQTNDVLTKTYDDRALVRILENSSALIFDGWLDDTSLIKTIVLADSTSLGSSPTGFVTASNTIPTWRIPLISFVVIIVLAGLFFNPFFSVMNMFEKGSVQTFTSKVHECIDASMAQEHQKVIQLIPKVLDIHEKLSKEDQSDTSTIINQVREMFYDSTYQITLKKISSKEPHKWTYDELEIAIKDFYGSYAKLSPSKQKVYLPYYNQMLHYCQELLSQVKKR